MHQIQLIQGYIEPVGAGVLDLKVFAVHISHPDLFQTLELADSVIDVDQEVPIFQAFQGEESAPGRSVDPGSLMGSTPEHLLLGDYSQFELRQAESSRDLSHQDREGRSGEKLLRQGEEEVIFP